MELIYVFLPSVIFLIGVCIGAFFTHHARTAIRSLRLKLQAGRLRRRYQSVCEKRRGEPRRAVPFSTPCSNGSSAMP